jgi:hypothetical protein
MEKVKYFEVIFGRKLPFNQRIKYKPSQALEPLGLIPFVNK